MTPDMDPALAAPLVPSSTKLYFCLIVDDFPPLFLNYLVLIPYRKNTPVPIISRRPRRVRARVNWRIARFTTSPSSSRRYSRCCLQKLSEVKGERGWGWWMEKRQGCVRATPQLSTAAHRPQIGQCVSRLREGNFDALGMSKVTYIV